MADILGKKYSDFYKAYDIGGKEVPLNLRPIELVMKSGQGLFNSDYLYSRTGDSKFPAAVTTSPVYLSGKLVGVVEVLRDISKEKEVDRIKTEFVSLASHQLRTPLSAIKWWVEIMSTDHPEDLTNIQVDSLTKIGQSNERMIELVNSLLNVSRIESGGVATKAELTDIGDLVKNSIEKLKKDIDQKEQKVNVVVQPDLPKIMIDPRLISQVYTNLLSNSIQYSPSGSEIRVEVIRDGNMIVSSVTDTGIGIPAVERGKVFGRFYRSSGAVRQNTEGSGLGLYISKAIVEQSGGKIWFDSKGEGKGTTFWFSLPVLN